MKWIRHHVKPRSSWRLWFAFFPTVVHSNDQFTDWVWLELYKWRINKQGRVERTERWSRADPYEVWPETWP